MKGQKLFVTLLTLASIGFMSSCKKTDTSVSSSRDQASSSSTAEDTSDAGIYAEEDAAHVAQAYKGAFSSGKDGVDYSGMTGAERASILGDMEAWGLKNHILGVPLFGDGGWTLMNPRVQGPIGNNYVANYGFGFAREGKIISNMTADQEPNEAYRSFLHQGLNEFDGELNQFDSNNSSSSELLSYLNGALYGQRLVKDNNGGYQKYFEWYASMADGEPVAQDFDEETQTATTWRVKVRSNDNMKYHTASTKSINGTAISSYDGKKITAKDFVTSYRIMLNGNCSNSYATQYAKKFVGGEAYYNASANTKVFTSDDDALWESNGVGIKLIDDDTIEFKFKTACTKSYAMMDLSMAPTNEDFFKLVTQWNDATKYNSKNFGKNVAELNLSPEDTLLSSGAYTLSKYSVGTGSDNEIVFTRNDNFIDRVLENNDKYEVYAIKGYVYKISAAYKGESGVTTMYNEYLAGKLDAASIPSDKKGDWAGDKSGKYVTGNTSVTSLQVNSTTEERWNEVFGAKGTNWKNQTDYSYDASKAAAYTIKPVMSNSDFLDGIYFSINRQELADSLMVNPSNNWLAEAYVMDVNDWVSYDDTAAHKRAIADYAPETYGYSRAVAQTKFKSAMATLTEAGKYTKGTAANPTQITISLQVAADSQKTNWGNKVKNYIEEAFNSVMNAEGYNLTVELPSAPASVMDIYGILASGCYDLCWGGISGGTADALGMTGCWVDSWDFGLQMSVGAATNEDSGEGGIIHEGYSYSFEAMFAAFEYGEPIIITEGVFTGFPTDEQ